MRIELSGRTFHFPPECVCCGSVASTEFVASATKTRGKRTVTSTTREWRFPSCAACEAHRATYGSANLPAFFSVLLGVVLAVVLWWWLFPIGVVTAVLLVQSAHSKAESERSEKCVTASAPARFVGWQGTVHVFDVQSTDYARAFLALNSHKAVNIRPDARALLSQVPSPADASRRRTATPADPRTRTIAEWVSRLESQRGPASRRAVLSEALRASGTEEDRQLLLLEASRIEVDAVLAKVDALKTPGAKRRHLQAALEELRSDAVSDDLQLQQIQWLEEALSESEKPAD